MSNDVLYLIVIVCLFRFTVDSHAAQENINVCLDANIESLPSAQEETAGSDLAPIQK